METYIDRVVEKVSNIAGLYNKELIKYYALLVLIKEKDVTAKDVHDGWAMSMNYREKSDHCWGHEHKSIVPYEELNREVQEKDFYFVRELRKIAKELKEER